MRVDLCDDGGPGPSRRPLIVPRPTASRGRPGVDLRPCTGERAPGLTRRGDSSPGWPTNFFTASAFPKRKPGGGTGLPTVSCGAWLWGCRGWMRRLACN